MTRGSKAKPRYVFGILTVPSKDIFRSCYHAELLSGLFRRFAGCGHELKVFTPARSSYRSLNGILLDHGLDGLLVLTWRWIHPAISRLIETQRHERVLVFNDPVPGLRVNLFYTDVTRGMAQAVRYLLRQGHRRIGMLRGPDAVPFRVRGKTVRVPFIDTRLKERGFIRAMRTAGAPCDRSWIREGRANTEGEGYRIMRLWLREKRFPEAVVCGNDDLAFGALKALREYGREAAVIGFDDNARAKEFAPSLTTVRQPLARMGEDAAALLIRQREIRNPRPVTRGYLPRLVVRDSA